LERFEQEDLPENDLFAIRDDAGVFDDYDVAADQNTYSAFV